MSMMDVEVVVAGERSSIKAHQARHSLCVKELEHVATPAADACSGSALRAHAKHQRRQV